MKDLISQWKKDEQALFRGWDFSYLKGRWIEEKPPWDYEKEAKQLIKKAKAVLDMGTGGGEKFSLLGPFPKYTVVTESWLPNIPIAKKKLEPLGIRVVEVNESGKLPFNNEEFDLVLNRHSAFNPQEVFQILKQGGIFLTQQVGSDNLRDLIQEFNTEANFKQWALNIARENLEKAGFKIEKAKKWMGKAEFKDVGAIIYFLKAIPWIIEDFSVDNYLSTLQKLQYKLTKEEKLIFTETRFLIKAKKYENNSFGIKISKKEKIV